MCWEVWRELASDDTTITMDSHHSAPCGSNLALSSTYTPLCTETFVDPANTLAQIPSCCFLCSYTFDIDESGVHHLFVKRSSEPTHGSGNEKPWS
mmetsp:Transcript_118891/g.167037  ORF Transcript_118891/g.167037 Transcript_118891/m.167037 type:complete len:95 (-) Transcript_118891:48-332(-)